MDQSEDNKVWEEKNPWTSNWRAWLLIAGCVATAVGSARSAGVLELDLNRSYFQSKSFSRQKKAKTTPLNLASPTETKNEYDETFDIRTSSVGLNFEVKAAIGKCVGDPEREDLAALVKQRLEGEDFHFSNIRVEELDMSGLYWVPLLKNGTRKFAISIDEQLADGIYTANFKGSYDFTIYGICSTSAINRIVAQSISNRIVKTVKDDFEKK